jgi:hypothetical protein
MRGSPEFRHEVNVAADIAAVVVVERGVADVWEPAIEVAGEGETSKTGLMQIVQALRLHRLAPRLAQ